MKQILSLFIAVNILLLAGCSSVAFNERYTNAKWETVLIAPFSGDEHNIAEQEFEHALAVSTQLKIIPASMVKIYIENNKLTEEFNQNPTKAMLKLAKILKADGFIIATIENVEPSRQRSTDIVSNSASIYARLIDAKDMSIVASSQDESSSIFSDTSALIKEVSLESIAEFKQAFNLINGKG